MNASHERHSIVTRALLLVCTTAVILLNTRVLGASGQGEIAWIQLGILVVTGVSGFLAGGAVVYLQKEFPLRAMLLPGHVWLIVSAVLGTWGGISAGFLPAEHFGAMAGLGWLQGAIIFHSQLLLADHRIRQHNVLQMLQGGLLLAGLLVAFFGMQRQSVGAFIGALAVSLGLTAALSIIWVAKLPTTETPTAPVKVVRQLWRFGRSAQTGALLQMLTNRSNLSILAQSSAGLAATGVYSIAYYGLEAMWLVPRALAPLVYTRTAAEPNRYIRLEATRKALGQALLGTASLLVVAVLIPDNWFAWAFGVAGIQPVVHALAPAAFLGAAASILAHHLSGIGKHHWNAATSGLGLITLLILASEWTHEFGAVGAAWAASAAAVIQCAGLLIAWWRCERIGD
jgi:O-antigen/teichoic acid export membrane protein